MINLSQMKETNSQSTRRIFVFWIIFICGILTIYSGKFPEVYLFSTNPLQSQFRRILEAPIHLSDDVMISLRTGYIFNEIGIPAFNRVDIAQPSTSYLSPYLFWLLLKFFSNNISVAFYALLGFLSEILIFGAIAYSAKSKVNAVLGNHPEFM